MLPRHSKLLTCLIAGGLASLATVPAMAQLGDQEGIVRISDSVDPSAGAAGKSIQPIPENSSYAGHISNSDWAEVSCPECPGGRRLVRRHRGTGYDFSPPVKRPIYRTGVSYQKMYPDSWTGRPSAAVPGYQYPSVYTPTDTTQLGYYYQQVPYWQPREGMVPPPPVPSQWHTTVAQSRFTGHHPAGKILGYAPTAIPNNPTGPYGPYGAGDVIYGSPVEAIQGSPVPTKSVVPAEPSPIDAAPASIQKTSNGLSPMEFSPQLIPTN